MRKPALTPQALAREYARCLARERDRERKYRMSEQGAFESSMVHIDFAEEENRERERAPSWLSDGGEGAAAIRGCDERRLESEQTEEKKRRLDTAKHRVARNCPECLPVFWLIIKNTTNREESICQLMQRTRGIAARRKRATGNLSPRS